MNAKIFEQIRQLKQQILPNEKVILFGSQARGDERKDSDWDLLILLDKDKRTPEDTDNYAYPFGELGWGFGVAINAIVYTKKQWEQGKIFPFYLFVFTLHASNNDRCRRAIVTAVFIGAVRDKRAIVDDGVAFERQRPVNHSVIRCMTVVFHLHAPGKPTPPVGSRPPEHDDAVINPRVTAGISVFEQTRVPVNSCELFRDGVA